MGTPVVMPEHVSPLTHTHAPVQAYQGTICCLFYPTPFVVGPPPTTSTPGRGRSEAGGGGVLMIKTNRVEDSRSSNRTG